MTNTNRSQQKRDTDASDKAAEDKKTDTPEVEPEVKLPVYVVKAKDLDLASTVIRNYHIFVPEGTKIDQILDAKSYAHIGGSLDRLARITVTEVSCKWTAELMVIESTKTGANVALLSYKEIECNRKLEHYGDHEPVFINVQELYGVIRKSDKTYVVTGLATMADASKIAHSKNNLQ